MVEVTQREPASATARVVFLDVLRLIAAVQMVQGHTLDALLSERERAGRWFQIWTSARGLTSTTFLVCAGMAFALAVREGSKRGRVHRVRRASMLIAVGYAMHAPLGALFGERWEVALRGFYAVDVLQCIGVSLLLLEGLSAAIPSRVWLSRVVGFLGAACFMSTVVTNRFATVGWPFFTNYLTSWHGSLFPLLPWSGFVFWGTGIGLAVLPTLRDGQVQSAALRLLGRALFVLAAAALAGLGTVLVPAAQLRPEAAFARLALVLLLAALVVAVLEGRWVLPRLLRRLASETLFLYVSHVVVLYAGVVGMAHVLGRSLSLPSALLVALLLLVWCSAGALAYRRVVQALRGDKAGGTRGAKSSPISSSR